MSVATDKLKRGLSSSKGMLSKFGKGLGKLTLGVTALGGALGALTIAGVMKQFDSLDRLSKFSNEVGLTATQLSALQLAAGKNGASIQTLEKGLQILTRRTGEARQNLGVATTAFKQFGLSADALSKMPAIDVLQTVAKKIQALETPSEKSTAAFQLMGRQGLEMMTFLENLNVDQAMKESERLGGAFSKFDLAQTEKMNDQILELKTGLGNAFKMLALKVSPIVSSVIEKFGEMGEKGWSISEVVTSGFRLAVKAAGIMTDVVHTIGIGFDFLEATTAIAIGGILKGIAKLAQGLQWLANKIPGVTLTFGDELNKLSDSVLNDADKLFKKANDNLLLDPPSVGIDNFFKDLDAKRKAAEAKMQTTGKKIGSSISAGLIKATEAAGKLKDKLLEAIKFRGLSGDDLAIAKLEGSGVKTDELKALNAKVKLMKKEDELKKSLADKAKQIIQSTKTDIELNKEKLQELISLKNKGLISQSVFDKAKGKLQPKTESNNNPFAKSGRFGSSEARQIIARSKGLGKNNPAKKQLAFAKKQTELQNKMVASLATIAGQKPEQIMAI